jgi:hypothetical protein
MPGLFGGIAENRNRSNSTPFSEWAARPDRALDVDDVARTQGDLRVRVDLPKATRPMR